MQYKSPITFSFIFLLLVVDTLLILLGPIFLSSYLIVFIILVLIDLYFISTIKTIIIKDNYLTVSNLFLTKKYSINQLKYVEVYYRFNKYLQRSLIFRFENNKIIFEIPDYNISEVEKLIKFMSENKVTININSNLEIHQGLKKYVN